MEISAARLRYLLTLLAEVAPKKPTLPILSYALFRKGEAHATNLDTRLRVAVEESDQTFLMPLRDVLALIKTVPSYEQVHVTVTGDRLQLVAGGQKAIFPTGKPDEWPSGAEVQPPKEPEGSWAVDGDLFLKGLTAVERYAAKDKSRPVLHGVLVELGERDTTFVAVDGSRMGAMTLPIVFVLPEGKQSQLVLDRDTVATLSAVWGTADKPPVAAPDAPVRQIALARRLARLQYDRGAFHFAFGDVALQGQLVQGEFPKWRSLVPKNATTSVQVLSEELRQAIKPIARFSGVVRLGWSGNRLTISAQADGQEFETQLSVRQEGQDGQAGYGVNYLQEYLSQVSGLVLLQWGDVTSPMVLLAPRYVSCYLMPVFLEAKAKAQAGPVAVAPAAEEPAAVKAESEVGPTPERQGAKTKRNTKAKVKA